MCHDPGERPQVREHLPRVNEVRWRNAFLVRLVNLQVRTANIPLVLDLIEEDDAKGHHGIIFLCVLLVQR